MSEVAIRVDGLSKQYHIGARQESYKMLREELTESFLAPFRRAGKLLRGQATGAAELDETIWALKDVSFEIRRGEVVGIIGRNGAGKSTLLKILSRITEPTEGFAEIRGRVGSLLEVGTGFHPELTGRENVYLNGAILGMKQTEINRKLDEIVAFAEVEKFLDTPVKHYSSGMYLRLAFSVAAHLEPEILLVDEVLAVGDAAFQKKCLGRMESVAREGRTVLFVSHNLTAIQNLCHRGIVFQEGKVGFSGSSKHAVDYYLHHVNANKRASGSHIVDLSDRLHRPGENLPLLERLELFTDGGKPLNGGLPIGASLQVRVYFRLENPTPSFEVGLGFDNLLEQRIFTAHSLFEPNRKHEVRVGKQVFVCEIPSLTLVPGEYKLAVGLKIANVDVDGVQDAIRFTIIESDYYGTGKPPFNGVCVLKHHWYLK